MNCPVCGRNNDPKPPFYVDSCLCEVNALLRKELMPLILYQISDMRPGEVKTVCTGFNPVVITMDTTTIEERNKLIAEYWESRR